jgi:hypothetical protein
MLAVTLRAQGHGVVPGHVAFSLPGREICATCTLRLAPRGWRARRGESLVAEVVSGGLELIQLNAVDSIVRALLSLPCPQAAMNDMKAHVRDLDML